MKGNFASRKTFYVCAALFAAMLFGFFMIGIFGGADTTVYMSEDGFDPESITIPVGGTVVFVNAGEFDHWPASDDHPTHEIYPEFDPQRPLPPGGEWRFRFDRAGEWKYHDHLFPHLRATVVVYEEDEEKPSPITSRVHKAATEVEKIFKKRDNRTDGDARQTKEIEDVVEASAEEVYAGLTFECSSDFLCAARALRELTTDHGPQTAIAILEYLQRDNRIRRTVDEHQLAHQVGRQTAETFGLSPESFLACPTTFNYGCQHGFFEYVLARTDSVKEAASLVCDSFGDEYPSKLRFYCYHGVGHGVMMARANDLDVSLELCNTFADAVAQEGCWQGVFMENVNAGMLGEARAGVFSHDDPLAPCDRLEERYHHECYINHGGWLIHVFGNDMAAASRACMGAPEGIPRRACFQTLGLMVSNPSWQPSLYRGVASGNAAVADALCRMFPVEGMRDCVIGAVDNIMNFDELDISRAHEFCTMMDVGDRATCFERIGISLKSQAPNDTIVRERCGELGEFFRHCLAGAGL